MGLYYRVEDESGTVLLVPSCRGIFRTEKGDGAVQFNCPGDTVLRNVKRVDVITEADMVSMGPVAVVATHS